jgi:predicted permease
LALDANEADMQTFLQDLQYALRQLRKSRAFAGTAILSLALGIGATTAVFSVVYAVLMNPYPYRGADRMVHLVLEKKTGGRFFVGLTGPQLQQLRLAKSVESAVAEDDWSLTTTDGDVPDDVAGVYLTSNAFDHFGVPALIGRGLIPSDAPYGRDPQPVVVLSYAFWQRHYNGNLDIVGKSIQLVHKTYTIVGVAQPRFTWGDGDVYLPLKLTADPTHQFSPATKLQPGVSHEAANAEFQSLFEQFARETPGHFPDAGFRVRVQGLNDMFVERLGRTLFLLLGAVGLLLVIGCANVSILLLARGTARQHELAIRAAVGSSRVRILRQLLTESLVLSAAGALLGVLLAYRALSAIVAWLPEFSFPHEAAIAINLPVLFFSVGLALETGILFGLSPALQFSRPDLSQVMQASARKLTAGVRGKRTHNILVASQIALTLVLLTAAGGAMAGFLRLMHTSLGYDPHDTMSVGLPVHDGTFKTWEQRSAYFDQIQQKIASMPEIVAASISTNATPPDNGAEVKFEIQGGAAREQERIRANLISPEYFAVLHIPLLQGRLWDRAETLHGARVAVINQTMARKFWPQGDAIGQQIRLPEMKAEPPYRLAPAGSDSWMRIVGVVADAKDDGLRNPVKPAAYVPYTLFLQMYTQFLVRTRVPPLTVLHLIRTEIQRINADQQVANNTRDLEHWISRQREWAQGRFVATLFGAFSILALVLAAIGLYSVVSYGVAQRTNEFGIRMALGASRSDVLRLVFASTAISVGGGLAVGGVLSVALGRLISSWAEGSSRDPYILIGVVVLLAGVSVMACLLPARRASSIDPITALRYE